MRTYAYTLTDKVWEIPKAELTCGSEIAKGQCGVSDLILMLHLWTWGLTVFSPNI